MTGSFPSHGPQDDRTSPVQLASSRSEMLGLADTIPVNYHLVRRVVAPGLQLSADGPHVTATDVLTEEVWERDMDFSDWDIGPEARTEVLVRLAEQAMTDTAFRAEARDDLASALQRHGYDLNADEWALVSRFRDTLEEAGVDLSLEHQITPETLEAILSR